MKKENCIFCRLYTFFMIVYPILSIYGFGSTPLNVADIIGIIFIILIIMVGINSVEIKDEYCEVGQINPFLLPFLIYIIFHLIISLFIRYEINSDDFIGSTGRYIVYLILIIFGGNKYFDYKSGMNIYRNVVIFSTVFLILQVLIANVFHYYLKGQLNIALFPVLRTELSKYGNNYDGSFYIRPRSIFAEPAHYAEFVSGYLTLHLFSNKNILVSILITVGILLSASSTGVLVCSFIWITYFIYKNKNRISPLKILSVILFLLILYTFIANTEVYDLISRRFEDGYSAKARFDGYNKINFANIAYQIFGYGNGGTDLGNIYYAGFPSLYLYYGMFGVALFITLTIIIFFRINTKGKILLIIFLFLNVGTELLFQPMVILFYLFIQSNSKNLYIDEKCRC